MNEETSVYLLDLATDLAYTHFDDPSEEHIKTIFGRLTINHEWGLGDTGAVTVH